jgi:DNA-binding MarR family transcriptional regulator
MMFFHKIHHLKRHIEHFFGHGQILTALSRKGPMTQGELLEIVAEESVSRSDIPLDKILSELKKQKLITRENNGEDKRGDVISLTKRGELFARRIQMHNHFILNMSESLSGEEKDQLATILERLRSNTGGDEYSHFHFRGSHFDFGDHGHDRHRDHTGGKGEK